MTLLAYAVRVAPAKPVASDDFAPGEHQRFWSPTASTLIHGERDAVLVDPLLTIDEARALTNWVLGKGRNLIAVYVTHPHGDHFLGAPVVLDRFPKARLVARPEVAARMPLSWSDEKWERRFPGQIAHRPVPVEPLDDGVLELEGMPLHAIPLGHTDTDVSSALQEPDGRLVVPGDAVYGDVHLHLGESARGGRQKWLDALHKLDRLGPAAVISGHQRDGEAETPATIGRTRRYLQDFATAAGQAGSPLDLFRAMVDRYPDRLNRAALWDSARAVLA
jgi:glyoxylase-like metal-dependent hydrolase (beta-lactamase superfamily II)